ncbi:MAG: HPF/RaiA family ribosome-associated protein [Treponema sp.]|jgi:putative sigma-54 modulation protein|nr:HPF/RaiA family ribosome-associated protein [Treponema sp.]
MTKSISAQGFSLEKDQSDLINQKLQRIAYAEDKIVDLILRVKEDKKYYFDATINFKWGANAHLTSDDFDFAAGLNKLMDVLDNKIKKEKDKVQEKK